MSGERLRLFLELFTLASFLATGLWARRRWGRDGAWLYLALLALGLVRENYVVLRRVLYGYADLALMAGAAPAIGAVIWGFSIVAALAAAEAIGGEPLAPARMPGVRALALVALFMVALAGFYEPFLARVEMARWEPGTATLLGVPKIALLGYPSFALLSVALVAGVLGRLAATGPRLAALALGVPALALGHAWTLDRLKTALGW
jgi:hypothetical protein